MKKWYCIAIAISAVHFSTAQNIVITKKGQVSFFSKTPLENIDAVNNEASSALNTQNGEIVFAVLVKGFHFERALMEEHFNENYMESDKLPKSMFKGKINGFSSLNLGKDGSYAISAEGELTVHGITKRINIPGTIIVKGGQVQATAKFKIDPREYAITIPAIVADKIAEMINVSVDCKYEVKK
jgi:YceI-like domain